MAYKIDSITANTINTETSILRQNFQVLENFYGYSALTAYTTFNLSEINQYPNLGEIKTYKFKAKIDISDYESDSYGVFLGLIFTKNESPVKITNFKGSFNQNPWVLSPESGGGSYLYSEGATVETSIGSDKIDYATIVCENVDPNIWFIGAFFSSADYFKTFVGLELDIESSESLVYEFENIYI